MSMQIEFKDEYNETTYYFGTVKEPELSSHGEYNFTVVVAKFSNARNWVITEIEWSDEPKEKDKAEKRIADIVKEWHGERCDIKMTVELDKSRIAQDPGDENDVPKKRSMISSIGYRGEE